MFGVLVIKDTEGKLGYLAAFRATWLEATTMRFRSAGVRPPATRRIFRIEEAEISGINHRIATMETSKAYCSAREEWKKAEEEAQATLASENKS